MALSAKKRAAVLFTAPLAFVLGTYGLVGASAGDPMDGIINTFLAIAIVSWIATIPARSSTVDGVRAYVPPLVAACALATAQAAIGGVAAYWIIISTMSNLDDPFVLIVSLMVVPFVGVASMIIVHCIGSAADVKPRTVGIIAALQSAVVLTATAFGNGTACLIASAIAAAAALPIFLRRQTPR